MRRAGAWMWARGSSRLHLLAFEHALDELARLGGDAAFFLRALHFLAGFFRGGFQQRHATLSRFFSLLGLDAETQQLDIEGIEHHLSPATVSCLADLAGFLESNPEVLKQFTASRKTPSRAAK